MTNGRLCGRPPGAGARGEGRTPEGAAATAFGRCAGAGRGRLSAGVGPSGYGPYRFAAWWRRRPCAGPPVPAPGPRLYGSTDSGCLHPWRSSGTGHRPGARPAGTAARRRKRHRAGLRAILPPLPASPPGGQVLRSGPAWPQPPAASWASPRAPSPRRGLLRRRHAAGPGREAGRGGRRRSLVRGPAGSSPCAGRPPRRSTRSTPSGPGSLTSPVADAPGAVPGPGRGGELPPFAVHFAPRPRS